MEYKVYYAVQAVKALKKLDRHTRTLLLAWIEKNLVRCNHLRWSNSTSCIEQWRYRIGDHRLIAQTTDDTITILIITSAHPYEPPAVEQ